LGLHPSRHQADRRQSVEIEASGSRIIVDLGLPLDAPEADLALVPKISDLREHDPSLLAIVLSHGHRDHWGLVPKVRHDIPIVMGKATERIMRAAADLPPQAPHYRLFPPAASQR
jgi:ribonuclease J